MARCRERALASFDTMTEAGGATNASFMLADAGASVLLTRSTLRAHLPAHDAHVDDLDAD